MCVHLTRVAIPSTAAALRAVDMVVLVRGAYGSWRSESEQACAGSMRRYKQALATQASTASYARGKPASNIFFERDACRGISKHCQGEREADGMHPTSREKQGRHCQRSICPPRALAYAPVLLGELAGVCLNHREGIQSERGILPRKTIHGGLTRMAHTARRHMLPTS